MPRGQKAKKAGAVQEADRGMSKPTPIALILVGIGLGLFGLHIFGIEPFQHKLVLAISICLVERKSCSNSWSVETRV